MHRTCKFGHVGWKAFCGASPSTSHAFIQPLRWSSTLARVAESTPEAPVLVKSVFGSRQFILNRPKRLNALNLDMIKIMLPTLEAWEASELANVVILKGAGKALSAGGDVRDVSSLVKNKDPRLNDVMKQEYKLLHTIATLKTPYVALMDGITMGAGAALCVHGGFRVATENTMFAMPETAIGIFPDVGSSFFLTRLDGQLGTYLAMTGNTIKAEDVLFSGIATHFVPSARLGALEDRLAEIDSADPELINGAIEEFAAEDDSSVRFSLGGLSRKTIDSCFKYDTVEEIIAALERDGTKFALETRSTLLKRPPTALKITLEQMRTGVNLDISQCLKMEHKLLQKVLFHHDFYEGVSSHLVNKTQPQWRPDCLSKVDRTYIQSEFFNGSVESQLDLPLGNNYKMHPFRKYTLPSEEDIRRVVTNEGRLFPENMMHQTIVDYFVAERKGKFGVREKVNEVLGRKTRISADGHKEKLQWVY
ncbi:hypothetical protein DFQ28_004707 [Apophysomyces sp. BC1034]|nr:hypothetical protein DFQ30_004563 [Apophysomyces sp. BC1015]KAG0178277.1 hypothetical protein DFQ29_003685 [Apophysomyces sp. BC1021]KAG0188550.1 hypothetical protein DFQ28_004707 [Apophysomyces sp. BC1034]